MFVCPNHVHCYRFHLVTAAKVRKHLFLRSMLYITEVHRLLFIRFLPASLPNTPVIDMFYDIFHMVNHWRPYAYQCKSITEKERCSFVVLDKLPSEQEYVQCSFTFILNLSLLPLEFFNFLFPYLPLHMNIH